MSFVSILFLLAAGAAACLHYALPARFRVAYLLALSYGFYATWSLPYLALLLAASALVYLAGQRIAAVSGEGQKKLFLGAGIGGLLALVIAFKLAGEIRGMLFPLGLSYYSFKLIAYLVEVYWDDSVCEPDFWAFMLYPAFFPQIVSGPIQRPLEFFTQLRRQAMARADYAQIEAGMRLILGGLMLKLLIADRLNAFIAAVELQPASYNHQIILLEACCFTLQLYADFAGYTNIAIGIGKLFGITAPPNFAAPFAASNIQEMWRRWHMSLTSWVTDYLFMPLQMALRGLGHVSTILCITISMVVIGLWHGLTCNFLVFGLCHAVFVSATALTAKLRRRIFGIHVVTRVIGYGIGVPLTFVAMTFSQLFWRTGTWANAMQHINLVFGRTPCGTLGWEGMRTEVAEPVMICMALAAYFGAGAPGLRWLAGRIGLIVPAWVQYGLALLLISTLTIEAGSSFIYGQF